jgi:hypothetical protein
VQACDTVTAPSRDETVAGGDALVMEGVKDHAANLRLGEEKLLARLRRWLELLD